MTDILKELYLDYYEGKHTPSADSRKVCRAETDFWNRLNLSEEVLSELQIKEADVITEANIDWFREGFRLGASLMLELLD